MPARTPLPPEALSAGTDNFYALLNEAQDVSAIIVGVSYIDACLASLLLKHFRSCSTSEQLLDSRSGPIGSFFARSGLAYALGLVDKFMYKDLQTLAELRNEVAHNHFALDFCSPEIISRCNRLAYAENLKDGGTGAALFEKRLLSTPRDRFKLTAVMIATRLLLIALSEKHAASEA